MLDSRPIGTPMDPNSKLVPRQNKLIHDPRHYRRLIRKLNYLTMIQPDIAFVSPK